MRDVLNLNSDRDSRSGGAKGIKRSKSMTEILFNKEHLEPTGASSSQLSDDMMSTLKDDSKNQINALVEVFIPIKKEINILKDKINKMSYEDIEQIMKNQNEAQEIVKQLGEIGRAGYDDGTKQNQLDEIARGVSKRLLEDAMECRVRLMAPLRDAQVKIWEGTWSEDTIANLMKTSEVVSSETISSCLTCPEKITLSCGLTGVWKPDRSNDWFAWCHETEIAAYQVNKLLGLNIVPLTVEREINGVVGSLQLWVNNIYDKCDEGGQHLIDKAKFFCALIGRNDGRVSVSGDCHNCGFIGMGSDRRVVLFDNADAFSYFRGTAFTDFELVFDRSSFQLPESVLEKARQLNKDQLKNNNYLKKHPYTIGETVEEILGKLLACRDRLIKIIDGQ
jgi:hypothetical protein